MVVVGGWVVRLVEVNRVVEVVYRHEENWGVKGPNKDVGLPMTMPQAAGKKGVSSDQDSTCWWSVGNAAVTHSGDDILND